MTFLAARGQLFNEIITTPCKILHILLRKGLIQLNETFAGEPVVFVLFVACLFANHCQELFLDTGASLQFSRPIEVIFDFSINVQSKLVL